MRCMLPTVAGQLSAWLVTGTLLSVSAPAAAQKEEQTGKVEVTVVDKRTGEPVPCRIHLKNAAGEPQRADGLPFWHDHFVCPGRVQLELPPGRYTYEVERGPEYERERGTFTLTEASDERIEVELARLAKLAEEGWWSGELHVHRPVEDIELLMRAEDLHVAPVITWWNNRNLWTHRPLPPDPLVRFDGDRYYHVMAGEDEREGGALMYFNLNQPLAITGAGREYPSPMQFLAEARRYDGAWVDVEKPFWWDVPIWLASGEVDSIGIANNHMCRSRMYETEAWGKPRDTDRLPPPLGNGAWTQEIYYHVLNCGLRIPPSAGSASGVLPNPVGYNRVYVYTGENLDYDSWWEALRAGRCFVTNGPLLRCRAAGKLPGHVFAAPAGKQLDLDVCVELDARDPVRSLEIVKNGRVERSVSMDEWKATGSLGTVSFDEGGWFLVRAIAENERTFQFASTGPYYVEIGDTKRRISRASARFFLDWVIERAGRVKLDDPHQRGEVLKHHLEAERFWQDRLAQANAE